MELENKVCFKVELKEKGRRLDQFLPEKFPDISRTQLQNMIKEGLILIEGKSVKPGSKLKGGETVTAIFIEKKPIESLSPTELDFPLLYEDEEIVVINKPVGLTVHPGAGREKKSVVSCLLSHCTLSPFGAPLRPGVVHRLDKGTSGVMVLAKTEASHKKLAKIFSTHSVEKEYLAIIQGSIKEDRGRIEAAVERDRVQRKRMKVTRPDRGKMAKTGFEVIERFTGASLVKIIIETGRTHQIRVHMAFIGHPLLGDVQYGGSRFQGKPVHFLHSHRLCFKHPTTRKNLEVISPLPPAFSEAINTLRESQAGYSKSTKPERIF